MSCFTIEFMDRFLVHARLVLWQRVAVQMLRRHWFASIIELLATVVCFTQVGRIAPRPGELGNFTTARLFPARYAFPGEWPTFVVYQPPSAYAEDLLASYRKRAEIFEYLNVRSPVKAVRSELDLRDACRVQVREAFERDYVLCVSFHGVALPDGVNGSTGFPSLNYTLHMFAGGLPKVGFREPIEFGDQEPTYLEHLIQKAQVWIDTQHLALVDRNARFKKEWYTIYTRQFPQTALPLDNRGYREKVLLFLALSYCVPFCLRVSSAVTEAASGLRSVILHGGLLETAYWFGHLAVGVLMGAASGAVILFLMMTISEEGLPYLPPQTLSSGPLILTFFLFSCLSTMHALFVASLFETASIAITFSIFYWFPIMLFLPWQLIEGYESPLGSYLYASRHLKLISSMTPCLGTYWILKIVGISLDYDGSATWSVVTTRVLGMDNITVVEVWAVMVGTSLALAVLLLYSSLLQHRLRALITMVGSAIQVRRLFSGRRPTSEPIELGEDSSRLEPPPLNWETMVSVVDVTKGFGTTTSLNRISVNVYRGQITVLLGHNGAGKTTLMNVVAGMSLPDSGEVIIDGVDVVNFPEKARQIVSFCQQKSLFFPDLTVWEHLAFYATVVILDEPSSSLDPDSRRELWDVLLEMRRRSTTILLSTHDMHEADLLADRVILLCRGMVASTGSPTFLRNRFSSGSQLTIAKLDDTFSVDLVLSEVRQIVPEATVCEERMHDVSITLTQCNSEQITAVLRQLEWRSRELGITAVGLKATTLQDVYVSVYKATCGENSREYPLMTEMRPLHRGTTSMEGGVQRSLTVSHLAALWAKRWLCFTRSPSTMLVCWLLPVAVFFVQFRLEQDLLTKRNSLTARLDLVSREVDTKLIAIIPEELYPQAATFVQVDNVSVDFVQKYFNPWLQGTVPNIVSVASAKQMLLAIGFGNFLEYTRAFVFGSVFGHDELEAWWNPHAVLSSVISLNAMHTALLRHLSGDVTASIAMNVRLYKEEESTVGPLIDFSKAAKRDALSVVLPMFVRAVFIPLGAALCIAPMALQPSSERVGGVLTFQLMAGVSPLLFWAANLAFDLCVYALAWSFVGAQHPIFVYLVVTTLDLTRGIQAPRWVPLSLCPLPAFAFPWALLKLMQLNAENAQCKRYAQTKHLELYQLDVFCLALTSSNRFPGAMHFCCEREQ
ncbi:hypothetical protein MRX96_056241 [Rhipicephalus microplus]